MTRLPDVRPAFVTMAGVLATWYAAWRIEQAAGLHLDVVVLATVLALTLGRVIGREHGSSAATLLRLMALPVVALLADEVGRLLAKHEVIGGTVFVFVLAGAVWMRRFGRAASTLGTLVSLPFVTLLVAPVAIVPGTARTLWPAAMALLAFACVTVVHAIARRLRLVPPPTQEPAPPPGRATASARMAVQLLVALAASYAVGRWLFPEHWPWLVLSCYVVCSGNRGRGDVLHKGVLRLAGALAGTASATLLAGAFLAGDRIAVVLLFVVMAVALWLREASYAYWAAGATAMLALLNGYFGVGGPGELADRLLGVTIGAVIAVVVSWYVLPIRSTDAFRRRWADALAALSDLLTDLRERPGEADPAAFTHAVGRLEQLEPAFRFHRRTLHQLTAPHAEAHPADLVALLRGVRVRVVEVVRLPEECLCAHRGILAAWARLVGACRRRMHGEDGDASPVPMTGEATWDGATAALTALRFAFTISTWQRLGGVGRKS